MPTRSLKSRGPEHREVDQGISLGVSAKEARFDGGMAAVPAHLFNPRKSSWISRKGRKVCQGRKIRKGLNRKRVARVVSAIFFISSFLGVHCVLGVSLFFRI